VTERKIYFGSHGPYLYDDTDLIGDGDGDFSGQAYDSIVTDGDMFVGGDITVGSFSLEGASPDLNLHNTSDEDTDGGRESKIDFRGDQSGGEESSLAWIEGSHKGTGDDEKGQIKFYVNDGDDGDTPTEVLTIDEDGLDHGTLGGLGDPEDHPHYIALAIALGG